MITDGVGVGILFPRSLVVASLLSLLSLVFSLSPLSPLRLQALAGRACALTPRPLLQNCCQIHGDLHMGICLGRLFTCSLFTHSLPLLGVCFRRAGFGRQIWEEW